MEVDLEPVNVETMGHNFATIQPHHANSAASVAAKNSNRIRSAMGVRPQSSLGHNRKRSNSMARLASNFKMQSNFI